MVVLVVGAEISLLNKGFLPGDTIGERMELLATLQRPRALLGEIPARIVVGGLHPATRLKGNESRYRTVSSVTGATSRIREVAPSDDAYRPTADAAFSRNSEPSRM